MDRLVELSEPEQLADAMGFFLETISVGLRQAPRSIEECGAPDYEEVLAVVSVAADAEDARFPTRQEHTVFELGNRQDCYTLPCAVVVRVEPGLRVQTRSSQGRAIRRLHAASLDELLELRHDSWAGVTLREHLETTFGADRVPRKHETIVLKT